MLLHLAPPVSQDLSAAGKRAGLKHEANGDDETTRSGLLMEAVRIIKEMRKATNGEYPTFAVWENVPGAFSSNNGEDFRTVLQELIKIVEPTAVMPAVPSNGWAYADSYCGDGWSLAYRVFDAQYWGVPQRRRRIYLVLDLRGQRAGEVLFEREGVRGNFAEGRTPWQAAAGDAQDCTGADDCEGAVGFLRQLSGVEAQDEICPTILAASGESGNNKPCVAYTLKIRSGCEGGGKGALIQENKSATPATNNDQYLFQPVKRTGADDCDGKCVTHAVSNMSYWDSSQVAGTLTANNAGGSQRMPDKENFNCVIICYDAIGNGDGQTESTLTGDHDNRITDYTSVACDPKPIVYDGAGITSPVNASNPQPGDPCHTLNTDSRNYVCIPIAQADPVYCLQGNGIDRADTAGCNGKGWKEDTCYIVRRLTPTECARLQGFPDEWGHPDHKVDFTDEEYRFWLNVRNTHAAINGKQQKDYTKAQMLTWYNKLHTDSSEYKMWGNGISLPTALYVMQGIADALRNEMP